MLNNLIRIISRTVKMSDEEIELCKIYFEPLTISRNTVLEEEGKIPQYLYFVSSGFMRLFYYDENGDEQTNYLCLEIPPKETPVHRIK
jgi:CRP-like cAMP-binding protein